VATPDFNYLEIHGKTDQLIMGYDEQMRDRAELWLDIFNQLETHHPDELLSEKPPLTSIDIEKQHLTANKDEL
jgi:hypothetical protein